MSETYINLLSQKGNIRSRGLGRVVSVLLALGSGLPPHGQGRWPPANAGFLPPSLACPWSKGEGSLMGGHAGQNQVTEQQLAQLQCRLVGGKGNSGKTERRSAKLGSVTRWLLWP